ncbi:unnamed protein product [Rotaria sp. Silwood2]|nr:unnamed protein product [Rotaria sp. Silwood2]
MSVIGICVGLVVSILVFPLFATFDVENRLMYCLQDLQQIYNLIIQAYLSPDRISANVLLAQVSIAEDMINEAMVPIQMRLLEVKVEPTRFFQWIKNPKGERLINRTLEEQVHFVRALMLHIFSMKLMVKQAPFNDYHAYCRQDMESSLNQLNSSQSIVISHITSVARTSDDDFDVSLNDFQSSLQLFRSTYKRTRIRQVENALQSGTPVNSDDQLSHGFFVFQLNDIAQLLLDITGTTTKEKTTKEKKKRRSCKEYFKMDWSRLLGAIKITLIIGISSIFIMVPALAKTFGDGQFILITVCMTIGDTVGGTFTTMKIRLIGVVLGSMWAYIVCVTALNNVVQIFGMLSPWIFGCGFLKLVPEWGPTVLVATTTPMIIVLGRLPYYTVAPVDASAVLRIKEIAVALGLGVVLTIIIFPQFAVDLLKENIRTILQTCRQCVESMDNSFQQVFHQNDEYDSLTNGDEQIDIEIRPFLDRYQLEFHQLMNTQQILLGYASLEPTFWWFKNDFPTARYTLLAQQQRNMFWLLQNIDRALLCINECSVEDRKLIEDLQDQTIGERFFSNLREPLADLTHQLKKCLNLWSSYFTLTQTRCYRAIYECNCSSLTNFNESDLTKHETYFVQLLQAIDYFKEQHQKSLNRILEYFNGKINESDSPTMHVPYINNDQIDSILIATTSMFYSQSQLIHAALALGTTIYTILQLETTDLYQAF